MPPKALPLPLSWDHEALEANRQRATGDFVRRRLTLGDPDYAHQFEESLGLVRDLLDRTSGLSSLTPESVLDSPHLVTDIGRFVAGPPVSEDDFYTLLGLKAVRPGSESDVAKALGLVRDLVDQARFPWVPAKRDPTAAELNAAIVATASLRAVERARTGRRSAEKQRQETFVCDVLERAGLPRVRRVKSPDHDLDPGSFVHGAKFEGKQCDVLVRLYDERFLGIECKSSNSGVNSIKRLNDVSDKATVWRTARGARVVTGAVLAGVFDLSSLEQAQHKGVFLWWEHDLKPLCAYVLSTK